MTSVTFSLQLFNLFMLLWGLFFLSALEELVMAGAFSAWYWTFNKKDVPAAPLSLSAWRAFRYHLGTLAFGSLIIAIIRFIRIMIEFVEERLKEYSQDNPIVKVQSNPLNGSPVNGSIRLLVQILAGPILVFT